MMDSIKYFEISKATEEHDISFDLMTRSASMKPTTTSFQNERSRRRKTLATPAMPIEIVLNILEAVYYVNNRTSSDNTHTIDADFQPNRQLLRNCSLVCRSWRLPSQKLLFRSVKLSSQSDFYSFQKALSAAGNELGNAVVRMTVSLDPNHPDALLQHSFARAVCSCPNLYDLTLSLYGSSASNGTVLTGMAPNQEGTSLKLDSAMLDILRKNGPTISSMRINNWSNNGSCTSELLGIWPRLKMLSMGGVAPQFCSTTPEPPLIPCELSGLRMNFQSQPSYAFYKWVLGNSIESLRSLEFERDVPLPLFAFLLETYGQNLDSLSLPSCTNVDYLNAIKQCANLREIRTEGASTLPLLYKLLADNADQKLEHLAFGMNANTMLQPILEVIKKESLKAVSVLLWEGGENHTQMAALKIACAYQGVELRFSRNVRAFKEFVRGDPIPCTSYPRTTSLDNLSRMLRVSANL